MVFKINRAEFVSQEEFINTGRRCGAKIPNPLEMNRIRGEVNSMRSAFAGKLETVTINVQFTHVTNGSQGTITEDQRLKQIEVLNNAYSKTGVQFSYNPSSVRTIDKPGWFFMDLQPRRTCGKARTACPPRVFVKSLYCRVARRHTWLGNISTRSARR